MVVKDGTSYKQVTIRTNDKGVVLRGSQDGSAILTKNQFAVSAGQFILSRIDARNGAFGIVPEESEGAIVSNEFLAFDINEDEVEREFFDVFLQSPAFLEACIRASRGNTHRKRVEEDFFLNYQVNLPPIREQHTLIKQINEGRTNIATAQKKITHQETLLAEQHHSLAVEICGIEIVKVTKLSGANTFCKSSPNAASRNKRSARSCFRASGFLRRWQCGRSRWCRHCAAATAGVHDDAGAFPGFNESLARFAAVELHHEVVHVADFFEQGGRVGFHFFQERAAVTPRPAAPASLTAAVPRSRIEVVLFTNFQAGRS